MQGNEILSLNSQTCVGVRDQPLMGHLYKWHGRGYAKKSWLFDPSYANACRPTNIDANRAWRDAGTLSIVPPIVREKSAANGHRPVVPNKAMPACNHRQRLETETRDSCSVKVIDKPPEPRHALHPFKKTQDLNVFKMVGKERTDDKINRLGISVK